MGKGGDKLARGRIPELGGFVLACRENPSAVRTERSVADLILMDKGGHKLARSRIPELGAVISALAVRTRVPSGLNAA